MASAWQGPPAGLNTSTRYPASVKWKYGWLSSAHQNPTGQPVVVETPGLERTMATRLGRRGLTEFSVLWLMGGRSFRDVGRVATIGCIGLGRAPVIRSDSGGVGRRTDS